MRKSLLFFPAVFFAILSVSHEADAQQQYKFRQVSNMMGMKAETTIYVKGKRKRTEADGLMGMGKTVSIEQCDLKRTIRINDKKKLYYIEPFDNETEEVIDEDIKVAPKSKPTPSIAAAKNGGVITMWYSINDTGERKKMNGFIARHVWTTQRMVPSPDACMMKDSFIIKTDGWYIDLPDFSCPIQYRPSKSMAPTDSKKVECKDRFVTRRSGKGKLGFALTEIRTIIMGNKGAKTDEFTTSIETLELTTAKLDSMLFEIPLGYTETKNEGDLTDKFDMGDMKNYNPDYGNDKPALTDEKKDGAIRIGVYEPKGDAQVPGSVLQKHIVNTLMNGNIEAIAISSEDDAKNSKCDYTLTTDLTRVKQNSKVGGLLKAIKNTDPNATSSFTVEATQNLVKLADGSVRLQPRIDGKYDGRIEEAVKKGLDNGSQQVIKALH